MGAILDYPSAAIGTMPPGFNQAALQAQFAQESSVKVKKGKKGKVPMAPACPAAMTPSGLVEALINSKGQFGPEGVLRWDPMLVGGVPKAYEGMPFTEGDIEMNMRRSTDNKII